MLGIVFICLFIPCFVSGQDNPSANKLLNIARGKPTAQSSTLNWLGGTYDSNRAVDGNKNSDMFQGSCSHTAFSSNPWLYIDLLKEETITGFEITNRGDCCGDRLNGFEVRVGNSKENGGIKNQICVDKQVIPQGATKKFTCNKPIKGRYFYVRLPKENALVLCEVEVYSTAMKPKETVEVQEVFSGVKSFSYDNDEGRCVFVSFSENYSTWCTNRINQVFVQKNGKWQLVRGSLVSVSAGDAGIWGVTFSQRVHYRQGVSFEKPEGLTWTQTDGKLIQVSSGPKGIVWGVSPDGKVHCRKGITCENPMGDAWIDVPSSKNALRVSCNREGCWAVMIDGSLYFRFGVTAENCIGKTWEEVTYDKAYGNFVSVESSSSGLRTIAVSSRQNLYIWRGSFDNGAIKNGQWLRVGTEQYFHGTASYMGYLATTKNSQVRFLLKAPDCTDMKRNLDWINAGIGGNVCGISQGNIYQQQGKSWVQMDGTLRQISCSDNQIWGVNRYNEVFHRMGTRCSNIFGSGWHSVPGQLKHIDIGSFGTVYAVNNNDQIFRRQGITQENPMGDMWVSVPGRISAVSCGFHSCWGVDFRKSVHILTNNSEKSNFQPVNGLKLKLRRVEASGNEMVFGICEKNSLRMRMGVSKMNPMGTGWLKLFDSVYEMSPSNQRIFVIDSNKRVKECRFPKY